MPAKNSKKFEILRRRRQIAELYVQRHTQATIADKLRISQATVSADIKRIRREWRVSTLRGFYAVRRSQRLLGQAGPLVETTGQWRRAPQSRSSQAWYGAVIVVRQHGEC